MSWKCPECGADTDNDSQKCHCGYIIPQAQEPSASDNSAFGDGTKAILVLLLTAVANTIVTFKFNDFPLNTYSVTYYLTSGISMIIFLFLFFFIPAIFF